MPEAAQAAPSSEETAEAPVDKPRAGDWEVLKQEATTLYQRQKYEDAVEKYTASIISFQKLNGGKNPKAADARRTLAVLRMNRSMAQMQIVSQTQLSLNKKPGENMSKEMFNRAMRSHIDASSATDLDETNAEAWFRLGQSLLWMGTMPDQAVEARDALERAINSSTLTESIKPEVVEWLEYAKATVDGTPLPDLTTLVPPKPPQSKVVQKTQPLLRGKYEVGDWEALKQEGITLYEREKYKDAIEKYNAAIFSFQKLNGGSNPSDPNDRRSLSVLFMNRAMVQLEIVKQTQLSLNKTPGSQLSPEMFDRAMRSHIDASFAVDLNETNAEAWFRKGQSLLWMDNSRHRAREAVRAFELARDSSTLDESFVPELEDWLQYARATFDDQVPLPDGCSVQ